ncbi:MAG: transporter substrate-binding domain-containing protein [Clostridiales bacterium]|jgi:polar amino acid transport system substrate-binding protein|nr:transporter substrate-binding domain-containing protein [Clostridiales bacterium]
MKKILSLAVIVALSIGLAGCGAPEEGKTLNIGITDYPPLNYYENGKLIGFETEFAEEVCKELGMTPNFIIIDWGSKEIELKAKNIDVIWNGMTWTAKRAENMLLSDKYINNNGVLVVKNGVNEIKSVAVEKGSQAETTVDTDSFFEDKEVIKVDAMTKGFMEVSSGNVSATYCDYVAARGMLADGSDYTNLEIWDGYKGEADAFSMGFRKEDTELCGEINKIMAEMKADGRMKKIADKYGLGDLL